MVKSLKTHAHSDNQHSVPHAVIGFVLAVKGYMVWPQHLSVTASLFLVWI